MNILFVCTGNTCRSPMAAVLMNKIAEERNLDIQTESAGIFASCGTGATYEAAEVVKTYYDADLSKHRSKGISQELFDASDLILTMTKEQKLFFGNNKKVYTICEYAGLDYEISDPYGGDIEVYKKTAEQIYKAEEKVADRLEKENV